MPTREIIVKLEPRNTGVRYRNQRSDLDLAIALPDGFARYLNLAPKTDWLRKTMPFRIYWVTQDGAVRWE